MWSQINVRSSIRLTGGQQIDLKVSGHFLMPRKYFRKLKLKLKLKFQIPKSIALIFNRKSKQIFSQKVNKCLQIDYDHRLTPFCQSEPQGPR